MDWIQKELILLEELCNTDNIDAALYKLVCFYFYDKKDDISAVFYAQQHLNVNQTELPTLNYEVCSNNIVNYYSGVLLLTNNSYIDGVITTIMTLQHTSTKYPISVLVTKDVCIENIHVLLSLGAHILMVDKIKPLHEEYEVETDALMSLQQKGFHSALSKFYIYNLTQFKKIVYLDSDTWVLKNIDDLFFYPSGAAVKDVYGTVEKFCSGLLVIEPNEEVYKHLLDYFNNLPSSVSLIHDQAVLQEFFNTGPETPDMIIPIDYHLGVTYYSGHKEEYYYNQRNVRAYHIIDKKPGTQNLKYYLELKDLYPCYASLLLRYIEVVNYCIKELKDKGYDSPYLKYIE